MARITSSLFVSALVRRVQGAGGFAAILRKGADEAGAIHIVMRDRTGSVALYQPAPQHLMTGNESGERAFLLQETIGDEVALSAFAASEAKFDPDYWMVELETGSLAPGDLFDVRMP